MKNVSENSKVTLTVGQLKRLVKEAKIYNDGPGNHDSMTIDYDGQKIFIQQTANERCIIAADTPLGLYTECTGWDDYRNDEVKEVCQNAFQMKVGQTMPFIFGGTLTRVD